MQIGINRQLKQGMGPMLFEKRNHAGCGLPIVLCVLLALCLAGEVGAQELLRVTKGMSRVLNYGEKIKTISLADQEVADVVSITPTDLVVMGKKEGMTSLIVWGESGKFTVYDMKVDRNSSGQQVVLEVQVAEVNRSALSDYGVDFLIIDRDPDHIGDATKAVGSYAGDVTPPDPASRQLFAPEGVTGVVRWLGNQEEISAALNAMKRDGKINLLANPRLLCLSSESASFLVGGEIPVPVAQTSAGGYANITIEWKEYGVKLDFLPTIVDTNLVNLKITPEVSSLDYANMITFGGYNIPALRTRRADATVELNSTQSVVLGGLLSTEEFKTVKKVPILGSIPIINFFFSRRETSRQETELLIIISPRIISSLAREQIPPLPFDGKSK